MAGSSTDEEAGKILKPSLRIFFSVLSYKRLEIGGLLWTENFDAAISKGLVLLEKKMSSATFVRDQKL